MAYTGQKYRCYVRSDDGHTYNMTVIEHDGGLWIVPEWIATPYPNMHKPARLIRMDTLPHQSLGQIQKEFADQYQLDGPIPKAVLDGETTGTAGQQLDVLEAPDLLVRDV